MEPSATARCICEFSYAGHRIILTRASITALFAALCIHALGIRRNMGMSQRIAEHRAQLCLLCLKEVQKYWRINNNVLDLFLQYLDSSIATRLHGGGAQGDADAAANTKTAAAAADPGGTLMSPATNLDDSATAQAGGEKQPMDLFEDQYFNLVNGNWEGDDALGDLSLFLRGDEFMQGEGLDFLGRSL